MFLYLRSKQLNLLVMEKKLSKKVSKLHLDDEAIRKILYSLYQQEKFWFSFSESDLSDSDKKLAIHEYWGYKTLRTALDEMFRDNQTFVLVGMHYES